MQIYHAQQVSKRQTEPAKVTPYIHAREMKVYKSNPKSKKGKTVERLVSTQKLNKLLGIKGKKVRS